MKFNVGDIIKGTPRSSDRYNFTTEEMTKAEVIATLSPERIMIRIIEHESNLFIGDKCEVDPDYFDLVEAYSRRPIVIYKRGQEVIAIDKETGEKAIARCCPDDTFDFKTGAKLAFEKLFEPKKPTYYNGKIIFTEGDDIFKTGHVYEIKDGTIELSHGCIIPRMVEPFRNLDAIRDFFTSDKKRKGKSGWSHKTLKFIEVLDD